MHTAIIGASRGIGRAAALDLLRDPENTVSLLLRSPGSIEQDAEFADALRGSRVRMVKGDAYEPADLRELLADDSIDSVVSSLGAVYPNGKRQFSWSKGFLLPTPDVCTSATLALLQVLEERYKLGKAMPALVAVSVTGVGSSAAYLPYMYQAILPWLLQQTIDDKRGVETLLSHVSTTTAPPTEVDSPSSAVLDPRSLDELLPAFLPEVLIVRPAQLKDTDGSRLLRAGEEVTAYSTGRVELGKWIAGALRNRGEWLNRRVTVGF